jgi:predicted transcriptional regulator of viral defense system
MIITYPVIIMHRTGTEKIRSLSAQQAELVLGLIESGVEKITRNLVSERLQISDGHANKLLHDLTVKGWMHRYARGIYRVVPAEWGPNRLPNLHPPALALARAPEGYLGLATAAQMHGLTTQYRYTIWVMCERPRRPVTLKDDAGTVRFIRLRDQDRFGTQEIHRLGERLIISDIEKTALDCLAYGIGQFDFSELTAIVLAAFHEGRMSVLSEYIKRMNNGPLARRFGFLLEAANVTIATKLLKVLRAFPAPATPIKLNSARPTSAADAIDRVWGVAVNERIEELFQI